MIATTQTKKAAIPEPSLQGSTQTRLFLFRQGQAITPEEPSRGFKKIKYSEKAFGLIMRQAANKTPQAKKKESIQTGAKYYYCLQGMSWLHKNARRLSESRGFVGAL